MGLGIPIEHPTRVDLRRAARVCVALDRPIVHVEVCRPNAADVDFALAHLVPGHDCLVFLGRGQLALDELEPLALAIGGYTDVSCGSDTEPQIANVRVWPDKAQLHVWPMPAGGIDAAAALVERHLGVAVPRAVGEHEIAVAEPGRYASSDVRVGFVTRTLAIDVASPDRAAVFAMFREICGPTLTAGSISHPDARALAALPGYVHASGAAIEIYADLPVAAAVSLTERCGCDDWQAADLFYTPETGALWTYKIAPVSAEQQAAWLAWVDGGLARS